MNPGGRFAPQSNFGGFGGAIPDPRSDGGGVPSDHCPKNPAKKRDDRRTDKILAESPNSGPLSNRPIQQDGLYCSKSWNSRIFSFGAMASIFMTLKNRIISNLHSRDHPSCHLKWTRRGQFARI